MYIYIYIIGDTQSPVQLGEGHVLFFFLLFKLLLEKFRI